MATGQFGLVTRRALGPAAVCAFCTLLALAGLPRLSRAADAPAAGATGTWKWTFTGQGGNSVDVTLKLKQDGDKLTGTITGRDGKETEIKDGSIKDGQVSFKVTRKGRNDQEYTSSYNGTLSGDSIKGKIETGAAGGQSRSRDWEAKRAAE